MRLRSVAAAAAIMGFVCPASAGVRLTASTRPAAPAPRIVVGRALDTSRTSTIDIRRVTMTMEVAPERSRAVLTLTLVTSSATPVEATLDLVLPADARATGLVARIAGEPFPGVALPTYDAERLYNENAPYLDPALLQLVDSGDSTQTLELRA